MSQVAPNARLLASFLDGSWRRTMSAAFSHARRGCARGAAADRIGRRGAGMAADQTHAGAEGLRRGGGALPVRPNPRARERPPRRRARICREPPERTRHRPPDRQRMGGRKFLFGAVPARLWRLRPLRAAGPVRVGAPDAHATEADRIPENDIGDIFVDCGPDLGVCTIDLHKNFAPPPICPASRRSMRVRPRPRPVRPIFASWRSKIICASSSCIG